MMMNTGKDTMDTRNTLRWRLAPAWSLVSLLLIVVAVTELNNMFGSSMQSQMQFALVNLIIVVALQIFVGNSGVLSFGHIAFVSVGAWTVGLLTLDPALKQSLLSGLYPFLSTASAPWLVAVLIGGVVGLVLALVVAPILMRLNGLQAGIATFALLGVVNQVLTYWSGIGPQSGQSMAGLPTDLNLQETMLFALATIVFAWLIQRSRPARLLRAAREDGVAAPASGINVVTQRVIIFAISGFVAGIAGGLFALTNGVVSANLFFVDFTFLTLAMLVLGGAFSLFGAVVGALVFSLINVLLTNLENGLTVGSTTLTIPNGSRTIVLGLVLVLMLMYKPRGLTGGRELAWPLRKQPPPGTIVTND